MTDLSTSLILLHQCFLKGLSCHFLTCLRSLAVLLDQSSRFLLFIVLFWGFSNFQVFLQFILLTDSVHLVKFGIRLLQILTIDVMLLIQTPSAPLSNLLNLGLPEVTLRIVDEPSDWDQGDRCEHKGKPVFELIILL